MNRNKSVQTIISFIFIMLAAIAIGYLAHKESEYDIQMSNKADSIEANIDSISNHNSETAFFRMPPEDGLLKALRYYNVQHPEIVYTQAILESNLGKSSVYNRTNNLFGLYDSKNKDYYKFNHWTESILGYKTMIQRKYNQNEDYYDFLNRIGYATDDKYIYKLKKIYNNNF